jgi:hypothetical protein
MGARIALLTALGALCFAGTARAEDFSLDHFHSGVRDASAEGTVTFPDEGGATVTLTVTDRDADGACAAAWVTSNLPETTHESHEACQAAMQRTYTISLPGGSRCNVTFVEVLVGTIDHSEGDKTEVGESKRMSNPCPPAPTPTPVATPAPPAKIDAKLVFDWTWFPRWTINDSFRITEIPPGAAVELRCSGTHKGCPGSRKAVPVHDAQADVHRILRGRRIRAGAVLEVRITRPDMIGKVTTFKVRRARRPAQETRCLPPGAAKPMRC